MKVLSLALIFAITGTALAVDVSVSDISVDESMYSILVDSVEDGTPTRDSNKTTGQVKLKPAFVSEVKAITGLNPFSFDTDDITVQTSFVAGTSISHIDHYLHGNTVREAPIPDGDRVGFYTLNTNKDAFLEAEETCFPLEKGKLIHFDARIPHRTVVNSGDIRLIGPVVLTTMTDVWGEPTGACCVAGTCTNNVLQSVCSSVLGFFAASEACGNRICGCDSSSSSSDSRRRLGSPSDDEKAGTKEVDSME